MKRRERERERALTYLILFSFNVTQFVYISVPRVHKTAPNEDVLHVAGPLKHVKLRP